MRPCAFCAIVASGPTILETRAWVAFHDAKPRMAIHMLLVPRRHIQSLALLDSDEALDLPEAVRSLVAPLGGRYRVEVNGPARMGVHHLHLHFLK